MQKDIKIKCIDEKFLPFNYKIYIFNIQYNNVI